MKRLGTISIVVGAVLAASNGAFAMALAKGNLIGGGVELFSIIFGLVLALLSSLSVCTSGTMQ
jgi:hypothetical protein